MKKGKSRENINFQAKLKLYYKVPDSVLFGSPSPTLFASSLRSSMSWGVCNSSLGKYLASVIPRQSDTFLERSCPEEANKTEISVFKLEKLSRRRALSVGGD
ncbi:hypothetical protein RRG08_035358 [Elysia crispata]|uniref:Uncharacterized protein n=1 Tax=Elysia crispata TaxID=231223 RepID=A0AAE0Y3U3_9GAST|nr:hypothetical protein RRG08_035358 [Elysia crispata]